LLPVTEAWLAFDYSCLTVLHHHFMLGKGEIRSILQLLAAIYLYWKSFWKMDLILKCVTMMATIPFIGQFSIAVCMVSWRSTFKNWDSIGDHGAPPLHYAAFPPVLKILRLLVDKGAGLSVKNNVNLWSLFYQHLQPLSLGGNNE
jgi:hypothetical protein